MERAGKKWTEEQILNALGQAGLLGPTGHQANNAAGGGMFVLQSFPVTQAKGYKFDCQFVARDRVAGTIATQKQRISIQGDPAAPVVIAASNIATEPVLTNMANVPTMALALVGVNLQVQVTPAAAGNAFDVDCWLVEVQSQ